MHYQINGSYRREEGLETDAELHALGRENTSKQKEVEEEDTDVTEGLCASHGSKEENNLTRQQWWQSGGEDQLEPGYIEGAVDEALESPCDEIKETVQNLSHNSCGELEVWMTYILHRWNEIGTCLKEAKVRTCFH